MVGVPQAIEGKESVYVLSLARLILKKFPGFVEPHILLLK
jgi:hypothetical protein